MRSHRRIPFPRCLFGSAVLCRRYVHSRLRIQVLRFLFDCACVSVSVVCAPVTKPSPSISVWSACVSVSVVCAPSTNPIPSMSVLDEFCISGVCSGHEAKSFYFCLACVRIGVGGMCTGQRTPLSRFLFWIVLYRRFALPSRNRDLRFLFDCHEYLCRLYVHHRQSPFPRCLFWIVLYQRCALPVTKPSPSISVWPGVCIGICCVRSCHKS